MRTERRSHSHLLGFAEPCAGAVVAVGRVVAGEVEEAQYRLLHGKRLRRKPHRLLQQNPLHLPHLLLRVHDVYTLYYCHASCILDPLMSIVFGVAPSESVLVLKFKLESVRGSGLNIGRLGAARLIRKQRHFLSVANF